jgi:threonine/homoserine/homoserine lactone efflux protein
MAKKFIYNILLNLALIAMVFAGISSFKKEQYLVTVLAVVIFAFLFYLKIKLSKQVRAIIKENSKQKE